MLRWLVTLILLLVSGSGLSHADTLTGEVRGTVLDIDGRVPLSDVSVLLVNSDRGWEKRTKTDSRGAYAFLQLEPGRYSVEVSFGGYYKSRRTDVLIRLNRPKLVIPPFELRKLVPNPTRQITLRGEQTKTAIIDLSSPSSSPLILAIAEETGQTAMATLLDSALRFNYDLKRLASLPLLKGRSFDQLALLSPGVFRVPFVGAEGPAVGVGVGTAGQFSVNGLRGRSNNFTVDGSDNNDEDIGVRRQGFVSLVPQTIESLEDFQVVTSGFPAEVGRSSGAMVNAVSRSGTQIVHGSAYGFFNHHAMNAQGFFDQVFQDRVNEGRLNGGRFDNDDLSRGQFGGVFSGPILKERLFFFLSAEYQRFKGDRLGHFVVPGEDERGLRTADGFVPIEGLSRFFAAHNIPYSDWAGRGVFSLYPLPNNRDGPFGAHTYSKAEPAEGRGAVASGKLDWYISPIHSFVGRYNFSDDDAVLPFTGQSISSRLGTDTRTQNISLFLNSNASGWGNALRMSYGRTTLAFPEDRSSPLLFGSSPEPGFPEGLIRSVVTSYGRFGPFGATGPVGQLSIVPYSSIGIDVFNFPQGRTDNTFQLSDFGTLIRGNHTLKMGFDIRWSQLNSFADRNSRPLVMFGQGLISTGCQLNPGCLFATSDGLLRGTDAAALGAAAGFLQTISTGPVADTAVGLRFTQYDVFVQDTWRLSPRLSLNLGLRYEFQTVPTESNRRIENTFDLAPQEFGHQEPGGSIQDRLIIEAGNSAFDRSLDAWNRFLGGRTRIYAPDRTNFAPRIGFAWDPIGGGKTVVRGGYGLNYDATLGAVTSQSRNVFPSFVPVNLDPNFRPPDGLILNSPTFFDFVPSGTPLIAPGTLNSYNLPPEAFATGLGTLFLQAPAFPGGDLSSNGLAFTLPEQRFRRAYAQHFSLTVERQFGPTYLGSLSYVGTRGVRQTRFLTPNAGLVSTPLLISSAFLGPLLVTDIPPRLSSQETGRPEPELGAFTVFANSSPSSFHSLQLMLQKRFSKGLQFQGSWTWSHTIDEVSDPFDGRGAFALPQNAGDLSLERGAAGFDVRHRVSYYLLWDVPEWSRVFRNLQLSLIGELQSGQPYTVNTSLDRNFDGNLTDRLNSSDGLSLRAGEQEAIRLDPALDTMSLVAARGQDGLVGRNTFRADGIAAIDLALQRRFSLSESASLKVRIEAFNLFNRTHFAVPIRILESPGFGRAFDTQVDPRTLRLSAYLVF